MGMLMAGSGDGGFVRHRRKLGGCGTAGSSREVPAGAATSQMLGKGPWGASRGAVGSPSRWDPGVTSTESLWGQQGGMPAVSAPGSAARCWVCVRGELPVGITGDGHALGHTEPRASCSAVTPGGGGSPRGDTNPARVAGRLRKGFAGEGAGTQRFAAQVRFLPSCPCPNYSLIPNYSLLPAPCGHWCWCCALIQL